MMGERTFDPNNLSLGKWPRLCVESMMDRALTFEETSEILLRTDDLFFSKNDWDDFQQKCKAFEINDQIWGDRYDKCTELHQRLQTLDLEYLNNDQISSSSIHGPKGWLNWDGIIGCNSYNIGKWPSVASVQAEWSLIAKEWPFLRLRCQLLESEVLYESKVSKPLVEFVISDGHVVVQAPTKVLNHGNMGCAGMPFVLVPTTIVKRAYEIVKRKYAVNT